MNKKNLELALKSFLKAWEQKNIDSVINLLSSSFRYYESPLDKPLTTKKQIKKLWAPVPKFEADISLSFKTLSIEKTYGLFRISGTYINSYGKTKKITKIDRIFLLSVDKKGEITKFMQWRESKNS